MEVFWYNLCHYHSFWQNREGNIQYVIVLVCVYAIDLKPIGAQLSMVKAKLGDYHGRQWHGSLCHQVITWNKQDILFHKEGFRYLYTLTVAERYKCKQIFCFPILLHLNICINDKTFDVFQLLTFSKPACIGKTCDITKAWNPFFIIHQFKCALGSEIVEITSLRNVISWYLYMIVVITCFKRGRCLHWNAEGLSTATVSLQQLQQIWFKWASYLWR